MRILLSNDDGILAPGLAALYAAVRDLGTVHVVAPDSPQSAAGHAITLRRPLSVRRVRIEGPPPLNGMSVDGRPADCVRLALRKLVSEPVDLVLAGINAGSNVGINVFYSGTVAAAAEAAMCGLPAVAFSASMGEQLDFAPIAARCREVLDLLLDIPLAPGELINVNIPPLDDGRARGIRVVRQSTAGLDDVYLPHLGEDGTEAYRLGDDYAFLPADQADTDVAALAEGYITITPLHIDMTRYDQAQQLDTLNIDY